MFHVQPIVRVVAHVREVRLLSTLELHVARAVREIRIRIRFRQKSGRVIVMPSSVTTAEIDFAQLDGDDGHGLDSVAAVGGAALVEGGILEIKIVLENSFFHCVDFHVKIKDLSTKVYF